LAKQVRRETDVVLRAIAAVVTGKRLEVNGKAGVVFYLGSTTADRRDPFWYGHTGGRTYKKTAEECVRAILPHVGVDAIDRAKVWPS
jgi:hypothetical protein